MSDPKSPVSDEATRLRAKVERERKARLEAESIAERATRDLYQTVESLKESNAELQRMREVLEHEVLELSTPVVEIWDRVVALPIIGTLDSDRAQRMMETLLEEVMRKGAEIVIMDISGVPVMDTGVAQHVIKTVQAARLMGVKSIVSGIRPETAQTIVNLGVDWGSIHTRASLRDALRLAFGLLGVRVGAAS